jgi:hypothetical protein
MHREEIRGHLEWARDHYLEYDELERREEILLARVPVKELRGELLDVLSNERDRSLWGAVINLLWSALYMDAEMAGDASRIAAHLEFVRRRVSAGDLSDVSEPENLIWSITAKVKGLDYQGNWEPGDDREVMAILEELEARDTALDD